MFIIIILVALILLRLSTPLFRYNAMTAVDIVGGLVVGAVGLLFVGAIFTGGGLLFAGFGVGMLILAFKVFSKGPEMRRVAYEADVAAVQTEIELRTVAAMPEAMKQEYWRKKIEAATPRVVVTPDDEAARAAWRASLARANRVGGGH